MSSSNVSDALIFGSIATAIVSLLSLSGACIIPLVTGAARQRWMQFFIAMAVSTLSSDALLHIIPEVMGVHNHHHHHHHHHHEEDEGHNSTRTRRHAEDEGLAEDRKHLLWISGVLLVVYTLYFFEFILFYRKRHVHHLENIGHCPAHDEQRIESGKTDDSSRSDSAAEPEKEEVVWCGLTSRALVILFGDAVHNFVDGIAMGASFLSGWEKGLAATLAIALHELPHELGDLAVLVDSGLPMCRALLLNLISALTAFAGLYVSIAVGQQGDGYQRVLLALTAGMFLYVAWIDMLHHLKHDSPPEDPWALVCCLQLAGFVIGFGLVFAIGWYEEDITNWRIN